MLLTIKQRWIFTLTFVVFWILGGTIFYSVTFLEPLYYFLNFDKQEVTLEGTLLPKNKNLFLTNLNGFPTYSPQILIKGTNNLMNEFSYQRIKISGVFRLFSSCATPGVTDLRKFYFQKRTVGYLEKIKVISNKKDNPWYQFMKSMGTLKEKLFKKWGDHLKETSPLFFSLLTGQKTKEFYEQSSIFQEVGVFHLFCVSGLHLGLVGGIILWIAQKFFPYRHFVPLLTSILFTFLYLCIASLAPSALRAWIMFSSYLLSLRVGRNTSQISYFLIALLIMVFLDPAIIFDTGAQLSFASTLGIIFFLQEGFHYLTIANTYLKIIWGSLGTTLFAIIFSMPFLLVKELTFSSLVFMGNILIAPFLEIILVFSLIIQPVAFFSPVLSQFFGKVLYHLFKALLLTAKKLTSLPHFFWDFSIEKEIMKGWLFWLILVETAIFLFLFRPKKTVRSKVTIILTFLIPIFCLGIFILRPPNQPQVWILDVGQGLSVGIINEERAVLIDAGGYLPQYGNIGKNVIGAFLHFKNVKKIDSLFITHFHEDHTNGTKGLIDIFGPLPIFVPSSGGLNLPQNASFFFKLSSYQELPIFEDITLKIFPIKAGLDPNNQALVFKICFPSFNILVTGDIEEEGMTKLAPFLSNLNSEVVIMPHHGKYLQNLKWFLENVKPHLAIISCGENSFGHPNPETISLLKELGIKVLITQKEGAICFQQTKRGGIQFAIRDKFSLF